MGRSFRVEVLDQHGDLISMPVRYESFHSVQLKHAQIKRAYTRERLGQGWRVRSVPEDEAPQGAEG